MIDPEEQLKQLCLKYGINVEKKKIKLASENKYVMSENLLCQKKLFYDYKLRKVLTKYGTKFFND